MRSTTDAACSRVAEGNGINEVTIGDVEEDGSRAYEAGLTVTRAESCDGGCSSGDGPSIIEADIIIDRSPPVPYRLRTCVQSVLLHEVGHFLGVTHMDPPSVMQTGTANCPTRLSNLDRAEVRRRYGSLFVPSDEPRKRDRFGYNPRGGRRNLPRRTQLQSI